MLPEKDKTVLVHPGGGVPVKHWPPENHAYLVEDLRKRGFAPVLVGGAGEERLLKAIVGLGGNGTPFILPTLRHFMALIAVARCVICMDSAAAHLAGNLGTPAVVLYGPQSPKLWRPVEGRSVLVRKDGCPKHPCRGRQCPRGYPAPCMAAITPDRVVEAFEDLMNMGWRHKPEPQ